MKLRKGDPVIVLTGKYKGKIAKILKSIPDKKRFIVEGVALAKIHYKAKSQEEKSQIIQKELSVHTSNIAFYDEKAKKSVKLGYKFTEDNKKVRYNKLSGEVI